METSIRQWSVGVGEFCTLVLLWLCTLSFELVLMLS